jgi:hypothetical protein
MQYHRPARLNLRVRRGPTRKLKVADELFDFQLGIAEDPTECARGKFPMKGNSDWSASRIGGVAQADVAALLTNGNVAVFAEDVDYVVARDDGELGAHRETRTLPTRTSLGSGMGSPRLSISSKTSSIASRIFARASETVLPCE